jgi:hypothetical protein
LLNHNSIASFSAAADFIGLNGLQTLYVVTQQINFHRHLYDCRDLSNNAIQVLSSGAFSGLASLQTLYVHAVLSLSTCFTYRISANARYLGSNPLSSIGFSAFSGLSVVSTLFVDSF